MDGNCCFMVSLALPVICVKPSFISFLLRVTTLSETAILVLQETKKDVYMVNEKTPLFENSSSVMVRIQDRPRSRGGRYSKILGKVLRTGMLISFKYY